MNERERAAIAAHPDLRRLAALRDQGGWQFMHHQDGTGDIRLSTGFRTWPDSTADVLRFAGPADARGWRTNAGGAVVWTRSGGLVEVIDDLLELPPPDAPNAPRLVAGSSRRLWTP